MKHRTCFWALPSAVLVLGLVLAGCDTGGGESGGSSGGKSVPSALEGTWLRDTEGTERYLRFKGSGFDTESDHPPSDSDLENHIILSVTENKIEYRIRYFDDDSVKRSFEWAVSGTTLTISNHTSSYPPTDGTYTKQ